MKVIVAGTDQELNVQGALAVGDILVYINVLAVVEADEETDEAKVVLVSTTANGIRASELFGDLQAIPSGEEAEEDDS